jgi:hypothetical protein
VQPGFVTPGTRLVALIQNQSFAQRATISNTLVLLTGVWGTPHLEKARSTTAKRKNISDALPLFVHPDFVTLRTGFKVFGRKMSVDMLRTKVAWLDCVPIKGRFLMR